MAMPIHWMTKNISKQQIAQTLMHTSLRSIRSLTVGAGAVALQPKAALRIPAKYMSGTLIVTNCEVYTQFACDRGAANYGKPHFRARENHARKGNV